VEILGRFFCFWRVLIGTKTVFILTELRGGDGATKTDTLATLENGFGSKYKIKHNFWVEASIEP